MKFAIAALLGLVASVLAAPVIEVGSFLFRESREIPPSLTSCSGQFYRNDRIPTLFQQHQLSEVAGGELLLVFGVVMARCRIASAGLKLTICIFVIESRGPGWKRDEDQPTTTPVVRGGWG